MTSSPDKCALTGDPGNTILRLWVALFERKISAIEPVEAMEAIELVDSLSWWRPRRSMHSAKVSTRRRLSEESTVVSKMD